MQVESLLKNHGLRLTQMRRDVLQCFLETDSAIAQSDLEEKMQNADRVTLYRTLKTFEQKGLIHQAVDGTNKAKFALCRDECSEADHKHDHAHFHCNECGNTYCLDDLVVPSAQIPNGFQVETSHLVLNGLCNSCN